MNRTKAVEYGIAVGLVIWLTVAVLSSARDDFSVVMLPAALAREPYGVLYYWYPPWNTWLLHLWALLPREVGLVAIWVFSICTALIASRRWGTPPWLVLVSPVLFECLFFGHPFEAMLLWGFVLIAEGWENDSWVSVGLGLALLAFKPQLGWAPGLFVTLLALQSSGIRKALAIPVALVASVTLFDFVATGRLWVIPLWPSLDLAPGTPWNSSPVLGWGPFALLWIPVGMWVLRRITGIRRQLWVATAVGLLLTPYWTTYSLWPLVAMVGCWGTNRAQSGT